MNFKIRKYCTRITRVFAVIVLCYCCYRVFFKCSWKQFPEDLARNQTWQPVNQAKTAFVFSAYLDEDRHIVIIIGAFTKDRTTYICQLWSDSDSGVFMVMDSSYPRAHTPPEHHDKRYAMTLFECPYRSTNLPQYVSLKSNTCDTPLNLMRIEETRKPVEYLNTFTVCLSPLNMEYRRANELVEWIELNRILGAEKFVVYNYSSASNVKDVLDYYSERDIVDVIQWRLPMAVDTFPVNEHAPEIHYFGQVAALNDCLYRNKRKSEFVVNIDLDEFIVPHGKTLYWTEMIHAVDNDKAKVFVFKNTHFRKDWYCEDIKVEKMVSLVKKSRQYQLTTLQTCKREQKIYIKGKRSKYIVRTNGVHYLLVHFVLGLPLAIDITVSEKIGLLHHYKSFGYDLKDKDSVTDSTVLDKYGERLVRNVELVWEELSQVNLGN